MYTMVGLKTTKWISSMLIGIISIPYISSAAIASQKVKIEPVIQSVVLFPLDKTAGVTKPGIAGQIDSFVLQGLSGNRKYQVIQFNNRLPAVQRMVTMQPEKKLADPPFSTDPAAIQRALMIGKAMSADLVVVGSLDNTTFDAKKGAAEVTAIVQILDVKNGAKNARTIAVTGRGTKPSPSAPGNEESVLAEAAKDGGRNILEAITGQPYKEIAAAQPTLDAQIARKKSNKSWLPILLLSLGLGVALGGSSGGSHTAASSGGGPSGPPGSPF